MGTIYYGTWALFNMFLLLHLTVGVVCMVTIIAYPPPSKHVDEIVCLNMGHFPDSWMFDVLGFLRQPPVCKYRQIPLCKHYICPLIHPDIVLILLFHGSDVAVEIITPAAMWRGTNLRLRNANVQLMQCLKAVHFHCIENQLNDSSFWLKFAH